VGYDSMRSGGPEESSWVAQSWWPWSGSLGSSVLVTLERIFEFFSLGNTEEG